MTYGDYLRSLNNEDMAYFIAHMMEKVVYKVDSLAIINVEAYQNAVLGILRKDVEDDC